MKKVLTIIVLGIVSLTASAQYQITNSDFEAAAASNGETTHWHGFKTASGSLASMAKGTLAVSTDVRPGTIGKQSIVITSGSVFGIVNNGTVTNGKLNAGSMTATNTANHSQMTSENGENYFSALTGHPDALRVWIKFSQASPNINYPYANISAIVWDPVKEKYYQDPEDKTYTNVLAKAQNKQVPTGDWTEYTVPFDYESYTSNGASTGAILVTFSTNSTPGKGSSGDKVYIDDMELVYNSELASATYDGAAVTFTNGAATVDANYDETKLTTTTTSLSDVATVEKNYDASTALLTITVKGEDISVNPTNLHTYTIQFKKPIVPGDLSGNGEEEVDESDVPLLIDILTGKTTDYILEVADVNGDGNVGLADLTTLVNMLLK